MPHPRADRYGDAADVTTEELALAGVQTSADLDAERLHVSRIAFAQRTLAAGRQTSRGNLARVLTSRPLNGQLHRTTASSASCELPPVPVAELAVPAR